MKTSYKKLFDAIQTIKEVSEKAKKEESDDFNWACINKLNETAQRILWHLTRGEEGLKDGYTLKVLVAKR